MLVYYITLLSPILYGLFEISNSNSAFGNKVTSVVYPKGIITKRRRAIAILIFLQLFVISALRSLNVGSDLGNYFIYYFSPAINSSLVDILTKRWSNSIGYNLLNWIVSIFTTDFHIFMIIACIIPLSMFMCFFYRESKAVWLSMLIFLGLSFLGHIFSALKQVIAMAIIAFSYKYVKSRDIKRFMLCIIIAVLFHSTAMACIPIYFFSHNKLNFQNYAKYILIALLVISGGSYVIEIAANYYRGGMYKDMIISGEGYMWLLFLIVMLLSGLMFKKTAIINDKDNLIIFNIVFLAVILQLVSLKFSLFVRVVYYYSFFLTVYLPNVIYSIKKKSLRIAGIFATVVLFSFLYFSELNRDTFGIVPYTFFWES